MSIEVCNLVRLAPGGTQRLLDNVSLKVPDGAFVALVGPSGAGKTTLLRAIAGLDACNGGSILLDDRPMTSVKETAGPLCLVFTNHHL